MLLGWRCAVRKQLQLPELWSQHRAVLCAPSAVLCCSARSAHTARKCCACRDSLFFSDFFFSPTKLHLKLYRIAGAHLVSRMSDEFCGSVLKISMYLQENSTTVSFQEKYFKVRAVGTCFQRRICFP